MLGNWPAERFEDAWKSYTLRIGLERIEADRRAMMNALYANGMIGGKDLENEIKSIGDNADEQRRRLLHLFDPTSDQREEEFLSDAPFLPKAGSDAVPS